MNVTIGDMAFEACHPSDLDAQLVASTGCGAGEISRALDGPAPAHLVARALIPFLGDQAPAMPVLASAIAAVGVDAVKSQVAALYAADPAAEQQSEEQAND